MKSIRSSKRFKGFSIVLSGLVVASSLFTFSLSGSASSTATADTDVSNSASFNTDVVYQIVTDRFKDGDTSNDYAGTLFDKSNPVKYHGGDWAGITQELNAGYFTDMGVTALWISPVVEQDPNINGTNNQAPYMGYWARDFFKTNPYFGTEADFQTLVNTAHSKGVKVIIDFAPNHTSIATYGSETFPGDGALYKNGSFVASYNNDPNGIFNHESDWTNFSTYENCVYHTLYGLADLNQMNTTTDAYLKDGIDQWLDLGVDGIRTDAVKHMPEGWLTNWTSNIYNHKPAYVFGEWYNGGESIDSQMKYFANTSGMNLEEFCLANVIRNITSGSSTMKNLDSVISSTASDYSEVNDQLTFIDNHDDDRITSVANGNTSKVDQDYVLLLTSRGVPNIYYGSEQYMTGISDPANRADMTSFNENTTAFKVISKLAPLHKKNPALAYGTTKQRWLSDNVYVYERQFGSSVVLTAVNNGSTDATLSGLCTNLPAGSYSDVLGGLLGGGTINVASTGLVSNGQYVLKAGQSAVWQYTASSAAAPTIGNVGPMMGYAGNTVTIDGRGFGTSVGSVLFGTTPASVVSWSDSEIKVNIPSVTPGTCSVTVKNAGGTSSNAYANFKVLTGKQTAVRFIVDNATTNWGQNVYLVGNCAELGNWNTSASTAIGPFFDSTASIASYPNWFYDVSVPAGTTIQYKFIKKDSSGNVVWESGSNHSYTVPSSGTGQVTVNWQN